MSHEVFLALSHLSLREAHLEGAETAALAQRPDGLVRGLKVHRHQLAPHVLKHLKAKNEKITKPLRTHRSHG